MKSIYSFFFLLLAISALGQSPKTKAVAGVNLTVYQGMRAMSAGNENAYSMTLPNTKQDEVEDAWSTFLKKSFKSKSKRDKKTKEYFADDVKLKSVSENTVDVYAKVNEVGDGTELSVWYDLGGAYLSAKDHPEQSPAAEQMLFDFGAMINKMQVEKEIDQESDQLKALKKDLKGYEKDQKKTEKKIAKLEKEMEKLREEIREVQKNKGMKQQEIEMKQSRINDMKNRLKEF